MLTFDAVTKRRSGSLHLDAVSFTAHPGRVTGLIGPNGAGKSSLLRILLGLDRATSGRALIGDREYRALARPLTVVGAALDGAGAHRSRTARAHLRWVAASNDIATSRVNEVLEAVGLTEHARRRVGQFSLGMGQRLGIAGALLGQPPCLVLDEPANGLDPDGIRWIRRLIRDQADAGHTVLVSSHLLAELEGVADDIVVLNRGQLVANGSVREVVGEHGSLESAYLGHTGGLAEGRPS